MKKILVDTSVWIRFLQTESQTNIVLQDLLLNHLVVTCLPIQAEVLSGEMSKQTAGVVDDFFNALDRIDLNWNENKSWLRVVHLAQLARTKKLGVCGIVDRMLVVAALHAKVSFWTYDKKLARLAKGLGVELYSVQ